MKLKTRNALSGYLLALPFLIGFAGFYLIPFLWSIRFTFTSGSGGTAFVGLRNYMDIFGSAAFRLAAFNTFRFILIAVSITAITSRLRRILCHIIIVSRSQRKVHRPASTGCQTKRPASFAATGLFFFG